ncbi:MAG: hypothetical protein RQ748_13065 [Elusimicrobiales bacterium]|nr:hypothetical protein [Elusimicrobiales bacterium]
MEGGGEAGAAFQHLRDEEGGGGAIGDAVEGGTAGEVPQKHGADQGLTI